MSASLVGSEMCIRDSARALGSARTHGPAKGLVGRGIAAFAPALARAAVSYTHLTLPTICSV
eukprot:6473547-Alexandrium_andersonii.AAC.1